MNRPTQGCIAVGEGFKELCYWVEEVLEVMVHNSEIPSWLARGDGVMERVRRVRIKFYAHEPCHHVCLCLSPSSRSIKGNIHVSASY